MSLQLTDTLRLVWNWGNFVHEDTEPRLVNTQSGESLAVLKGHTDYVRGALMLGSDRFVTWSNDCSIRVWSLDGTCQQVLLGHSAYIRSVFDLGAGQLVSSSGDETIRLWSLADGSCREIGDLGKDVRLLLVHQGRLVLSMERNHILLIDAAQGRTLKTFECTGSFPEVYPFDRSTFLIVDDDVVQCIRWNDGVRACRFELKPGSRCDAILALEPDRLLLASHRSGTALRQYFELWDVRQGVCLAERDISGETVLWLERGPMGNTVTAQMKDYRHLTLNAETLAPIIKAGVLAYQADGFVCYAPEEQHSKPCETTLNVTWLDPEKATCAIFDAKHETIGLHGCGELDDGRVVIAFRSHRRIYDHDFFQYETLSNEAFEDIHADYQRSKHWAQCLLGNPAALAHEAHLVRGLNAEAVLDALGSLRASMSDHLHLKAGTNGLFLVSSPKHHSIWRLSPLGTKFDLVLEGTEGAFIGKEPIGGHDGQLMRWIDTGLVPLKAIDGSTLKMHPDAVRFARDYCLQDNGHLLVRRGTGVCVLDSHTGKDVTVLESGHGMGMWGFCMPDGAPLVTWSRMSLRSWDPETYAPLVELKDPEDWGPGYEDVRAAPCGQVQFFAGEYTYDSRIMLWDGHHSLAVYSGHAPGEIYSVTALKPGLFLSQAESHVAGNSARIWQTPGALL
jgi:WD40 repeat protein